MKHYIIGITLFITFFYITIGEQDRMGTRAILRDSGAYLPK